MPERPSKPLAQPGREKLVGNRMNLAAPSSIPPTPQRSEFSRYEEPEIHTESRAHEESEESFDNTPFEAFLSPAVPEAKAVAPPTRITAPDLRTAGSGNESEKTQTNTIHPHAANMNLTERPEAEIETEARNNTKAPIAKSARSRAADPTLATEQIEPKTSDSPPKLAPSKSLPTSNSNSRQEITPSPSPFTHSNPELSKEIHPRISNREQGSLAAIPAEETPATRQERLPLGSLPLEKAIPQNSQTLKNPSKTSNSTPSTEAPSRSGISPAQRQSDTRSRPGSRGMNQAMERPKEQSNRSETPSIVASTPPSTDHSTGPTGAPRSPQANSLPLESSPLPQAPNQMASSGTAATFDPTAKASAPPMMQQSIEQIQSLIKDHALILKRFDQDTLTAEIRPDAKTSITLSLTKHADGITVSAQLDSQNAEWLKTHWGTLQSKLAEQNISLETPKERWDNESTPSHDRQTGQQGRQAHGENTPDTGSSQQTHRAAERSPQSRDGEQTEHSTEKVYWA